MKHFKIISFLLILSFSFSLQAENFRVRVIKKGHQEKIIGMKMSPLSLEGLTKRKLYSFPLFLSEDAPPSREIFEEYVISSDDFTKKHKEFLAKTILDETNPNFPESVEVRTLIHQGKSENRIDLTILGDGYLESEKEKFFEDALRITKGLFEGHTFSHYLPLFNVHAVFVPSHTSGIGDGSPQETAFKLYRSPKGSKRAIMPGNPEALEKALGLAPDTDYPIVIANDDFYGGLGGRYAISTRSERSGLIVLRHELGHNFGQVGEEYDNGYVYSGANSSHTPDTSWSHWIEGKQDSFESTLLTGDYVWKNLQNSPYTAKFSMPKKQNTLSSMISSVGWETPEDVSITLDGKSLPVTGNYHEDRSFFDFGPVKNLNSGKHEVRIEEKIKDGDNVLGFALFYAYPENYDFTPHRIAAFSTFDNVGQKFYRPTHNSCLMRNIAVDYFCKVDQENIWHKFLERISLIDAVEKKSVEETIVATIRTPPLPGLSYSWYRVEGHTEHAILENSEQAQMTLPKNHRYRVRVKFSTPDVRKTTPRFVSQQDF